MADENETKIRDAAGPDGTGSPAKSPVGVRGMSTSVYIIECTGYVKIGVAKDPLERLASINTGTPVVATLYRHRQFDDRLVAYHVESALHRTFRNMRANGEWFLIAPEDAWDALRTFKTRKVADRAARHDSLKRWGFSEEDDDFTVANLLLTRPSG